MDADESPPASQGEELHQLRGEADTLRQHVGTAESRLEAAEQVIEQLQQAKAVAESRCTAMLQEGTALQGAHSSLIGEYKAVVELLRKEREQGEVRQRELQAWANRTRQLEEQVKVAGKPQYDALQKEAERIRQEQAWGRGGALTEGDAGKRAGGEMSGPLPLS